MVAASAPKVSTKASAQSGLTPGCYRYVLTGTNGCLSIPTMRIKTYPRPEDRSWWKPFEVGTVGMVREDPIRHQMAHFGAVIRGEAAPLVTAEDGLANLRVTEAIVEAASCGRTVELG